MLMLCTDAIEVKAIGERLRLIVPSGSDNVEFDLSLNQTLRLCEALRRLVAFELTEGFASTPATVLRLRKPRKAKGV
ncbi:hypothetical protein D0Z70_22540 [Sphingobium terrigena]|uniref:Uncharacterized protein n=1 Tax=Sphingobium terrigena TaxID=2304063 RepID=A0A418YLF8_9SPHN|nr:hypothetical protein [Sphingobium terrigena]RJG51810.1 hypothetical protein D0Z70_22540 [Sphingobium terrigena]